jgi:hypothetical protein
MLPQVPTNALAPATICVLDAEVVARRHPRPGADDAPTRRDVEVRVVVFEHEPGIEQHHRRLFASAATARRIHSRTAGRVGQRARGVELHGDVLRRQQGPIDRSRRRLTVKRSVRIHEPIARWPDQ